MVASRLVAILAVIPLLPLLLILAVRLGLRAVGWYLLGNTTERKAAIIDRVKCEVAAVSEDERSHDTEDGWETIERTGSAENGKPLSDPWAGIVGFFHPFWSVILFRRL
jgi:flagellar biosynthesis component FlhA